MWPPSIADIGPEGIVRPYHPPGIRSRPLRCGGTEPSVRKRGKRPYGSPGACPGIAWGHVRDAAASFFATLFVALAALDPAAASLVTPGAKSAARCALELEALDQAGMIRLQTTALALHRPGELLVNLSRLRAGHSAFSRLTVSPDPDLTGRWGEGPRYEVTELIGTDPAGDLAWLLAPGLASCGAPRLGNDPTASESAWPSNEPLELTGEDRFIGLRDRDGYRSRLFDVSLERTIRVPGGGELMLLRLEDGAGARGGFLFDSQGRLAGSILRAGPDTDPSLACARRISVDAGSGWGGVRQPSPSTMPLEQIEDAPIVLFARALLLTRPDQTDDAIDLMNEIAARVGEFPDLLLERGVRRFRIGRTAPAIEDFSRAARLAPDDYLAHYNLGIALGAAGRFAEAARQFEQAVVIDPQQPRALYQLALSHEAALRPDLARSDYERLIARDLALASELRELLGF